MGAWQEQALAWCMAQVSLTLETSLSVSAVRVRACACVRISDTAAGPRRVHGPCVGLRVRVCACVCVCVCVRVCVCSAGRHGEPRMCLLAACSCI